MHCQGVENKQATQQWLTNAADDFNRFNCLHAANDANDRCKNAVVCTSLFLIAGCRIEAVVTGAGIQAFVEKRKPDFN